MPVRQSAFATLQSDFYAKNPSQGVGAGMLSKGYLVVIPATPTSNEQRDPLTTEVNNIAGAREDAKTGLDKAAQQMTDIMATGSPRDHLFRVTPPCPCGPPARTGPHLRDRATPSRRSPRRA